MHAGGQSRRGDGGGEDTLLRRRRQHDPSTSSSSSSPGAATSSSSGRGEEAGGVKKLWRHRKKQGSAVARAIRDGLPAAAASCWRGVTAAQETGDTRGRSQRRDRALTGSVSHGGDSSNSADGGSGAATAGATWCCACPGGDCSLEPNPSANNKEDPGLRALLERNDFFAADCNPHADGGLPSSVRL